MGVHVAGILLLCALAACQRQAVPPAVDATRAAARATPVAVSKGSAGQAVGGFGDAWSLRAPAAPARPDPAASAANPRKEMQDRIAKFRAARLRAQHGGPPAGPVRANPGLRPGDLAGQRAGDRAFQPAPEAGAAYFPAPGPTIGAGARAAYSPAMNSRIERFRAAQLSRNNGAVPNRPAALPGIPASIRPGDSPGSRPGDPAPPR